MSSAIRQAEHQRRQRAAQGVGVVLLLSVLTFLGWSLLRAEWPLAGMLAVVALVTAGLTLAARKGHHRLAGLAFSVMATVGVVGGAVLRKNPGYASFYLVVGVVLAAVVLEVRDVVIVAVIGLLGEAIVASVAPSNAPLDTLGGVYAEGTLLFVVVSLMALAMTGSLSQLLKDLFRRDAEAHAADERADRLSQQLEHSQRMEALGRLAGGVAHDFNNLLAVMQSCSSMIELELPAQSRARADLKDLSDAITRASGLTRQLLAFSRRDVVQVGIIDARAVVQDGVALAQTLLARLPSLRVVLVSGFTADPGALAPLLERGAVFLAKPFAPQALLDAIRGAPAEAKPPGA